MNLIQRQQKNLPSFQPSNNDYDYDVEYDKLLIEQSLAKQYGIIPSRQYELHYIDWYKLVGGLMADTPLGLVISIRTETDSDKLKQFTEEQNKIRRDWNNFKFSKQQKQEFDKQMKELSNMMNSFFI